VSAGGRETQRRVLPLSYAPDFDRPPITPMQAILEYAPWIVFGLVVAITKNIYMATAALMCAMTLLLAYYWIRTRAVPQLHLALTVMVLVFGGATLILHDVRFLQWKASIVYWLVGILFAGSVWVGKKTLLERMIGGGLPEGVTVPPASWRSGSLLLGAFNVLLGFVNIWVAKTHSQEDWAFFKVWIAVPIAMAFVVGVVLYLLRGASTKDPSP
jgi:intracellular septation protein